MTLKAIVGRNIRRLRERAGLSQEALADKCKLNSDYVAKCERGLMNMTLESLAKIAKGLKVDPAVLLSRETRAE